MALQRQTDILQISKNAYQKNEQPDLRGIDLSGANLSFVNLRRADLSGANLTGAFNSVYPCGLTGRCPQI